MNNYVYDKQVIKINAQSSILIDCRGNINNYKNHIYFNVNDDNIYLGTCRTNKLLGFFEWIEYDEQYVVLFSKSIKENVIKINKLFNINTKEFVNGDEQMLFNTYFRRKNKIKSKK